MQHVIGWSASILLLITIATQIARQWKEHSSKGVSRWLFIGQIAASGMFTIYSVMMQNYVFIVTNVLMTLSAIVGLSLVILHRHDGETAGAKTGGGAEGPA